MTESKLNKSESLRPPDYSDAGNASVFSRLYRNDLIHTDALGWLWWNGRRWERDEHRALSWAIALSERMLAEARQLSLNAMMRRTEGRMRAVRDGEESIRHALKMKNFRKFCLRNFVECVIIRYEKQPVAFGTY